MPSPTRPRQRGFTLVELLIVLLLMIVIALLGLPALQNMIQRSKTEGIARETANLMRLARIEGIKQGFRVAVQATSTGDQVVAWVDEVEDGTFDDSTETQVGGTLTLPRGVTFSKPGGGSPHDGFGGGDTVFFFSDGSASDTGAFRFGDARGNFLEVRVEPEATGRVEIRKWDGAAFKAQGEGGVSWSWS